LEVLQISSLNYHAVDKHKCPTQTSHVLSLKCWVQIRSEWVNRF